MGKGGSPLTWIAPYTAIPTPTVSLPGPLQNWKVDPQLLAELGVTGIALYTFVKMLGAILA